MGDIGTSRYKILKALNRHRVLSYSDLRRKTELNDNNFDRYINYLINERILIRWDFDGYHVLYSHCFIPWYEVKEVYEKKYTSNGQNRIHARIKLRRDLERVLR